MKSGKGRSDGGNVKFGHVGESFVVVKLALGDVRWLYVLWVECLLCPQLDDFAPLPAEWSWKLADDKEWGAEGEFPEGSSPALYVANQAVKMLFAQGFGTVMTSWRSLGLPEMVRPSQPLTVWRIAKAARLRTRRKWALSGPQWYHHVHIRKENAPGDKVAVFLGDIVILGLRKSEVVDSGCVPCRSVSDRFKFHTFCSLGRSPCSLISP